MIRTSIPLSRPLLMPLISMPLMPLPGAARQGYDTAAGTFLDKPSLPTAVPHSGTARRFPMNKVKLTIATTDYDHFRDFRLGFVPAEGIEVTWLNLGHHEIFSRFTFNREWDVSELSFAKFAAQVTRESADIIGLPVYSSRLFRFASFYVNRKAGIKTAKDLRGKRIGVPEWAHTAAVYMRGWLMHEGGVALSDIDWVQAGTNEAGRIEKVELSLPKGVQFTSMPEKTLSGMIASGELDCVIIARPPDSFREKHPDVARLSHAIRCPG